ncbi:hypothetical protein BBP40_010942 [Aspergillus hancockii]|nr:hypothetical protein BBP40_010942 [Aspergillus hancockii]
MSVKLCDIKQPAEWDSLPDKLELHYIGEVGGDQRDVLIMDYIIALDATEEYEYSGQVHLGRSPPLM